MNPDKPLNYHHSRRDARPAPARYGNLSTSSYPVAAQERSPPLPQVEPFATNNIAMTGEIMLPGKVLPVGGIREKVLAAYRAEVKTIILPKRNEPDLEDVSEDVRHELQFVLVDSAEEVLATTLSPNTIRLKIVRIDSEKYSDLAFQYQIHSLPTLMLFKNGQPVERIEEEHTENLMSAEHLIQCLQSLV